MVPNGGGRRAVKAGVGTAPAPSPPPRARGTSAQSQHVQLILNSAGTSVFSAKIFLSAQLPSSLEDIGLYEPPVKILL